jgi:hypothetical protein
MYKVRVGETLTLRLVITDGSIIGVESAICKMKRAGPRGSVPPANYPVIATFSTIATQDGWDFILQPSVTATLTPGVYIADAVLTLVGGEVDKTSPVLIEVLPSVT